MKKKLFIVLIMLLCVFCAGSFLLIPAGVNAAESNEIKPLVWIKVFPVDKRLYLTPGTSYEDEFTVENIGSDSFTFRVYASPFSVSSESYERDFTSETSFTQIARWIKFEQSEYDLDVGAKQIVKFTVDVPGDVPGGGQYATIFAESSGKKSDADTPISGLKTVTRVGLIVYAKLDGETVEDAQLIEYSLPTFYFSGNIFATSKLKNDGNTDFEARFRMEVRPLIGDVIFEKDGMYDVFPETERRVEYVWDQTPFLGLFKVNYSVSAPGIDHNETRLVLVVPLFMVIIVLLLLTSIAIWTILRVKRRRGLKKRIRISK